MKLDTLGIDDSATERDIDSGEIALERLEIQAFLKQMSNTALSVATGRRRRTRNSAYPPAR